LRDVFSKNFQSSMPFVWFLMFISFDQCGITGCVKFPLYGMRRLYVNMASVNQFHDDIRGKPFKVDFCGYVRTEVPITTDIAA
jgi:hypothetical protein